MSKKEEVPVLIVGGGIVGISASLFLAYHGVKSILVERHAKTSIHPRARSVNLRTMELFRRLGITDEIRKAGSSMKPTGGIYEGPSLMEVIGPHKRKDLGGKSPFEGFMASASPEYGVFVTQDKLEPVLVDQAKQRGVDVRFYHECTSVRQDGTKVIACMRDRSDGQEYTIESQYLIAADGAKSPIRAQLGVPITYNRSLGHLLNILFHADLKEFVRGREFSICVIDQTEVAGVFTSIDNDQRWVFHLSFDPGKGEKPEDYTPDRCKELLRMALGMPDITIDVESTMPWEPSVQIIERMRVDRIFFAGDAAHAMPPYAGQGANGGIADVHNLAWKLAMVLDKQMPDRLLDTYEAERLPVSKIAGDVSAAGVDHRGLIPGKRDIKFFRSVFPKAFIVAGLGYGYNGEAFSKESTWPLGGWTWKPWTVASLVFAIDGRPGRRLPHIWVSSSGQQISTLDVCGRGFVLFAGEEDTKWVSAAKEVSKAMGVNITAYAIGPKQELETASGVFEAAAGITKKGSILIRTDDYVVWRSRYQSSDCFADLNKAVRKALRLES